MTSLPLHILSSSAIQRRTESGFADALIESNAAALSVAPKSAF
jgi:hypothetical protein